VKAASSNPRLRRELARVYVDHERNLDEALSIARDEASRHRNVKNCDLLTWALFKKGLTRRLPGQSRRHCGSGLRMRGFAITPE
jgi:hypothetical protein